jgi:hypothetical protein
MNVVSLGGLRQADGRVLHFTSMGLSTGGRLTPASAARFQQQTIADAELSAAAPETVRAEYERLRSLRSYGVLCYDNFTAVVSLAPLVCDLALRERFLAHFERRFTLTARDGTESIRSFRTVDELTSHLWSTKGKMQGFDGPKLGFRELMLWAREAGYLTGERARRREELLVRWRNRLAHPSDYKLVMPIDSTREIRATAEFVNRLWGETTSGGDWYPAPLRRDVIGLSASESHSETGSFPGSWVEDPPDGEIVTLVRVVATDPGLHEFDPAFEATAYPVELLWGPGPFAEAVAWYRESEPASDSVAHVARWFVIRMDGLQIELPRTPAGAMQVASRERSGRWLLLRADYPLDAFAHSRHAKVADGDCPTCAVHQAFVGTWKHLITELKVRDLTA